MIFKPQKRVGSPAAFRGVRGTYLNTLIVYIVGTLFIILIFLMCPLTLLYRIVLTILIICFLLYKFTELKTASKGDLNKSIKKACRKTFVIKPKKHETSKP